jgi:hypothetical protein
VCGIVEQEEVADLVEVDLLTESLRERLEGPQTALPELDVDGVGELRAYATGCLAGRAGGELCLLDENDVTDAGGREVVRGTEADDATADDDDGRLGGELGSCHAAVPFETGVGRPLSPEHNHPPACEYRNASGLY